ncbi:MAG: protein translocase subunit SecF [candidate division Zixibacteria bacterium]|nr:protein translocase subunit SecF [candidate division Zixibacteria bacterium]NIR64444.1 protein translocase subunit SecF [candidate division Zixibacteria bacterium]NIS16440.1 protein translocase subunit SecF [candidate division Zixibacteria bacterium]NIS46357.1 protein translocase subunit SecF [candidate division Zixibacteria bacterium]NIT52797.1 protein translocase subunit SecF [candidate division Zixibacteria bacterium]
MFRLIGKTNIDFISKRKYSFTVSGILLLIGIAAFIMIVLGRANFSIDFSGGAEITGVFEEPVTTEELRSALATEGLAKARIQTVHVGDTLAFLIKLKSGMIDVSQEVEEAQTETGDSLMVAELNTSEIIADKIMSILIAEFPDNPFHRISSSITDPSIGRALKSSAGWMVLATILGILIYIWIRFDFRFGVAATFTTFHDVLLVLGILFLMGREVSILMVTALLTLAGYSLTDTVVVFDRIRENLKTFRRKGDFVSTVNLSINEVLSRTLVTSLTTLSVVIILFIFGGEILRDFSLTLILGIMVGTYSSVFMASPLIVVWENRSPKRFK